VKTLIGFDIRSSSAEYLEHEWTEDRRKTHLINPKILCPISMDTVVWPSVFISKDDLEFDPREARGWKEVISDEPYFNKFTRLWTDLEKMISRHKPGKDEKVVQIFWIGLDIFPDARIVSALEAGLLPQKVGNGAKTMSLGYDVGDQDLTSGLTNCGQGLENGNDFWREKLNIDGLFGEGNDAKAFSEYSNSGIPEHAPFFVYEIEQVLI
jgi:hypothetical protein